jgi:hypothetical protein
MVAVDCPAQQSNIPEICWELQLDHYERSYLTEITNEIGGSRDLMMVFSYVQKRVFCGGGRRLRQDNSVLSDLTGAFPIPPCGHAGMSLSRLAMN